jgi:transmembrane protein
MSTMTDVTRPNTRMASILARLVTAVLRSPALFYAAAAALTFIYWWSGFTKLWDLSGVEGEMMHFGLKPPLFFALSTIALQLGGSALILFGGRWAWLGAGALALALFTLATIPLAHDFWNMEGPVAFVEKTLVQEHIAVIGGLMLAAILAALKAERRVS